MVPTTPRPPTAQDSGRRALHRPNGVRLAPPLPLTTSFCPKCASSPTSEALCGPDPPDQADSAPTPPASSLHTPASPSSCAALGALQAALRSLQGPCVALSGRHAGPSAAWQGLDPTVPAVSPVPRRRAHLPSLSLPGVSPPGFSAPEEAQVQRRPAPTPAPERGSTASLSRSAPSLAAAAAAASAAACHAERATLPGPLPPQDAIQLLLGCSAPDHQGAAPPRRPEGHQQGAAPALA